MGETTAVEELTFSEFLASLDGSADPDGFERLSRLGEGYESVPVGVRPAFLKALDHYSLAHIANVIENYEPRAGFMDNVLRGDNDAGILKAATEADLVPANPKWFDREQIVPVRDVLLLDEGQTKERFFDENRNPGKGYDIPISIVVFFDGANISLGVKSDERLPGRVWTQHGHQIEGKDWHISEYVPVNKRKEAEVFHSGVLCALHARAFADLLHRLPYAFYKSLEDCVKLSSVKPEDLGNSYQYLMYEGGHKMIDTNSDPRIRRMLSSVPQGLEQSLKKLKDAGFFFDPSEIRRAYQTPGAQMPKGLTYLVAKEEIAYQDAATGVETSQTAVQEAMLCKEWGRAMLDFFYMFVSPDDAKAVVQLIPEDCKGYFLIGRNGTTEVTLSYTRDGQLSVENRYSMWNRDGFHENYAPDWVGAVSFESNPARYLSEHADGPLAARLWNAFCIATPVREQGMGGDFTLCHDKRYSGLFAEMAKYVSGSISSTHCMHT